MTAHQTNELHLHQRNWNVQSVYSIPWSTKLQKNLYKFIQSIGLFDLFLWIQNIINTKHRTVEQGVITFNFVDILHNYIGKDILFSCFKALIVSGWWRGLRWCWGRCGCSIRRAWSSGRWSWCLVSLLLCCFAFLDFLQCCNPSLLENGSVLCLSYHCHPNCFSVLFIHSGDIFYNSIAIAKK